MSAYVNIGSVIKPHGLKGAVACHVDALYFDVFQGAEMIFIDHSGSFVPYSISSTDALTKDRFKVQLAGVDDQSEAELLRGKEIFLPEEDLPEHAQIELEGFMVYIKSHGELGVISQVIEQSTQVLIEVEKDEQTWLIPFVEAFILSIDPEEQRIDMELPDGLLDI